MEQPIFEVKGPYVNVVDHSNHLSSACHDRNYGSKSRLESSRNRYACVRSDAAGTIAASRKLDNYLPLFSNEVNESYRMQSQALAEVLEKTKLPFIEQQPKPHK